MLNELYDYKHLKVDSVKNAFFSGEYELETNTDDKRIDLLDYIEQHLDKLDTMPKTELADEYGDDFEPNYMNDNYDIYLSFKSDYLFSITDDFNEYLDDYFYPDGEREPDEEEIEKIRKKYETEHETAIDECCKEYVEPLKNDCLKLVQLLSAKYDVLKYEFYTNYDSYRNKEYYYVRLSIYLKCK